MPSSDELSEGAGRFAGMDDAEFVAWMPIGHQVAPLVARLVRESEHFLVLAGRDGRYVQVHGTDDHGCYAEADSGEWTELALTAVQHDRMRSLGWRRPDEYEPRQEHWNYWIELDVPVNEYRLLVLLVRTLAEVFATRPEEVEVEFTPCDHPHDRKPVCDV